MTYKQIMEEFENYASEFFASSASDIKGQKRRFRENIEKYIDRAWADGYEAGQKKDINKKVKKDIARLSQLLAHRYPDEIGANGSESAIEVATRILDKKSRVKRFKQLLLRSKTNE